MAKNNGGYGLNIITVVDEDGVEYEFEELDRIVCDNEEYVALQRHFENPNDMLEDDGGMYILRSVADGDEFFLEPVEDEDLLSSLADMFDERLNDMYN